MPGIATLLANFFVNGADISIPGEMVPHTSAGNKVTPLVDGNNYFGALRTEVDALKLPGGSGKFFYFAKWWVMLVDNPGGTVGAGEGSTAWPVTLDPLSAFKLDDGSGGPFPDFIDELTDMAAHNTDVRALIWISPLILSYQEAAEQSQMYHINASNLISADALRGKPNMEKKVVLNLLAHPLGAMHLKMVVCGDSTGARAFVSGIDFVSNRVDSQSHPNGAIFGWHDAGAKVEGPAVAGVYAYYEQLWNEQISRSSETLLVGTHTVESHVSGTAPVPGRTFPASMPGNMHVQVLRTAPQMNFAYGSTPEVPKGCFTRLASGFRGDPWDSAPDGIFEFRAALHKAIMHAEKYIYVEDQGFVGQDIMDWLRIRLAASPNLKLIMVHHADPADGADVLRYTSTAINYHLGIAGVNMDGQVAFYERIDGVVIHTKTWIIDDAFVIIGSANCYRRSLYTDGEISVGAIDEDATVNNMAVYYRKLLWGEHSGLLTDPARAVLDDIDLALKIWDTSWGGVGAAPAALLPVFQRKRVPFEVGQAADQWQWPGGIETVTPLEYDRSDPDSQLEY